jgi:hypothetical protein
MAQKVVVNEEAGQMLIPSCICIYLVDILTVLLLNLDEDGEKSAEEQKHR